MNKDIKLIMMDMDGTLLNSMGRVSDENKRALKAAEASGVGITVVTGRMLRASAWVAEELALSLPISTYNGGLISAPFPPHEEKAHYRLNDKQSRDVIKLLRPFNTHINAYINDDLFVEEKSPEIIEYSRTRDAEYSVVGNFETIPSMECTKLLIIEKDLEKMKEIKAILIEKADAEIFQSAPDFCEVLPKGINKGTVVDFFANYLGIETSRIMAMGDQENDISMIEKAGIGIAMGNARDEVKAKADWVSSSNQEDGVARAVKKFIPNLSF
ncbi:MAG: HAD family phosphatase [Spirochaetales bacterium]|nr:HAD family phosphatase [Spirochaetales bacterium]